METVPKMKFHNIRYGINYILTYVTVTVTYAACRHSHITRADINETYSQSVWMRTYLNFYYE